MHNIFFYFFFNLIGNETHIKSIERLKVDYKTLMTIKNYQLFCTCSKASKPHISNQKSFNHTLAHASLIKFSPNRQKRFCLLDVFLICVQIICQRVE